ncbi:hypothetical protein RER83_16905 [Bacillus velezensis]|nr:hypothetical protein [Bacillus velezensis]MDL5025132.1 hypothetical protein [Bacillus velezensis]MDQ8057904.1 hypothetical protein [Bacillus velezensis]MEC3610596.1 hypothetical protein [Bacillus velezensis]MEC3680277.1 hypothetical protein [Bacillus velezensis]
MIDKNLAVSSRKVFLIGQKNMGSASSPNPCWLDTDVTMNEQA